MATQPNKTQATTLSVHDFIASVEPETKRIDAETLCEIMGRITGEAAVLWGPSIIGFGVRRYRYDSGREGEICRMGFSPRKTALVLYGLGGAENAEAVQALGKVATGKGCVYIKRLSDIDLGRLEALIERGWRT